MRFMKKLFFRNSSPEHLLEWSTQLYDEGAASYKAGTALGPVSPHPLVVETLAC